MKPPSFSIELERYMAALHRHERTQRHIRESERVLKRCFRELKNFREESRYLPRPQEITYDDLVELKHRIPGNTRNKQYQLSIVLAFLRKCGNPQDMPPLPNHIPNRPRLTRDELRSLTSYLDGWTSFEDHQLRTMVLLGLLTCRRKMAVGMKPGDIYPTHVRGIDKGRAGGSERVIPITPRIHADLAEFIEHRRRVIRQVIDENVSVEIPTSLFIWVYPRRMGNMSRATFEERIRNLGKGLGIHLSYHMLRRAGCEAMAANGIPASVAMKVSGHSTEEIYQQYVGLLEQEAEKAVDVIYESMLQPRKTDPVLRP